MDKKWARILALLLVAFLFSSVVYAAYLSGAEQVRLWKSFYFLISRAQHVEAGVYDAQLNGGAGYLLEYNHREYLVLSVYLDQADGVAVQSAVSDTELLSVTIERLYFKSRKQKQNATLYQSALECLYNCMEVLNFEIGRLEDGGTQQSSARTLEFLLKQLRYLSSVYEKDFEPCAQVCKRAGEDLGRILSKIIYAKDLRYLLCDMASGYISIANNFSL